LIAHVSAIFLLPVFQKLAIVGIAGRKVRLDYSDSPEHSAQPFRLHLSAIRPQKNPNLGLGPSGHAIHLFLCLSMKSQPKCRLGPLALPFERRKYPGPHFFARTMSASRSWTCCARLRPRRVWM